MARPATCPPRAASSSAYSPTRTSPPPRPSSPPATALLLYTDGLTEARTSANGTSLYGDEALLEFAADHAGKSAPDIIGALTDLLASFGDGLDDDTALLALGVPPLTAQS